MSKLCACLAVAALALAACGDDGDDDNGGPTAAPPADTAAEAPAKPDKPKEKPGTRITAADSEFGEMLFDSKEQAIYIFENDREDESVCYDECAEAWPPVFTDGAPKAGDGVDQRLLGTTKRRDGKLQVTYAGKPLYFYAHEAPGEVKCHNVNLNGGFWWVIGPDGERRS